MPIGGAIAGTAGRKYLTVKAGEAIVKGNLVAISDAADDGYTVVAADYNDIPAGVATASVASGEMVKIQVKGIGAVDMFTAEPVAAGTLLVAAFSGTVMGVDIFETDANTHYDDAPQLNRGTNTTPYAVFGFMVTDSYAGGARQRDDVIPAGTYVLTCPHSWWD